MSHIAPEAGMVRKSRALHHVYHTFNLCQIITLVTSSLSTEGFEATLHQQSFLLLAWIVNEAV